MTPNDYYPTWLGPAVVAGEAPWSAALQIPLASFLTSYSLHDSYWLGLYLEAGKEGLLAIRWDTHWTSGRVPFPGSHVAEWPVLLCRFTSLHDVSGGLAEDGIADAVTVPHPSFGEPPLHRTTISAHDGSNVSFSHAPVVELLCLGKEGQRLPIPT